MPKKAKKAKKASAVRNLTVEVAELFASLIAKNRDVLGGFWIMRSATALWLSLLKNSLGRQQYPGVSINGGTWHGLPVLTSEFAGENKIVLVLPHGSITLASK